MNRVGLFLAASLAVCLTCWSPPASAATIFTETAGSPAANTPVGAYAGWSNPGLTFTGTGDVRNTSQSSGYAGASGGGNVFLTNAAGTYFQIAGVNAAGHTSLTLSFGVFKSLNASTGSDLIVEVSGDGVSYTPLTFAALPSGTATAGWHLRTASGTVPAADNLRIRFTQNGSTTQYRVDDVSLSGTPRPTVSVGDVTLPEPHAPAGATTSSYAQFPVTLSEALTQSVTVSFSTSDGSAAAPGDYAALSGSLTFAPGETRKTVAVAVRSDSLSEPPETFGLSLSGAEGAAVGDGAGVATVTPPAAAGAVVISEFSLRGPAGPADEYVELYNNTDAEIIVADAHAADCLLQNVTLGLTTPCGWALVDAQGAASTSPVPRFVVPAGTIIPARGHYLAAGAGYGLSALAAADQTYDAPAYGDADFTGLALYKTAYRQRFDPANALDAVGFEGVAAAFREGSGLLPAGGVGTDARHAFVRNQGSGRPADTGDNRADFTLVATDPGLVAGGHATLGAPGPENLAGTKTQTPGFTVGVPPGVASGVRSATPVANGPLGTYSVRRRFRNNTGRTLTKLRFRVADVQTLGARQVYGNQAELRVIDAQLAGLGAAGLKATTVEAPAQPSGGGVNTGLLVEGSLTLAHPLQAGQTVDVEFLLGVVRDGKFQFVITVEAAP